MQLFLDLSMSISTHRDRNAFCINGVLYSYLDFAEAISKIRKALQTGNLGTQKVIGFVANDDLLTYAAIIAIWFEGKAYVPLSPAVPRDKNEKIIHRAELTTIIDSSVQPLFPEVNVIHSRTLSAAPVDLKPNKIVEDELAYLLFTSGTTGQPKGVPLTRANLTGFINAFWDMGFELDENDRCLQMFELTFDLSIMSYLVPLLKGACVYTIPNDKVKFAYIEQLMGEQKLTVALMVPSILHFLRPYFDEIDCPDMKYSLFCGEALPLDITEEWSKCLPNAKILNVYGPTEDTIFCSHYSFSRTGNNKSHNGVMSIGKAMNGTVMTIVDENNQVLNSGSVGQLCLGGVQLTPGYWNNEEKNNEAFFSISYQGKQERFYKTGDLCFSDETGDILYVGRADFQTKIQGFRVELSEVEFHVKTLLKKTNVIAIAIKDVIGNTEIGLVIESTEFDTLKLVEHMQAKMPAYMIPRRIEFIAEFMLNANGKTDRNKLELLFK